MVSAVCSVMWMVGYNIAIGLYVLDIVVSVVYSISDRTVHNGHVVSVVCFISGWWDLI